MSNLLNNDEGRNVVLEAQRHLLRRRIARFFKRNLVVDYQQWSNGGEFDLATLLGQLNVAWDDELRDLYRLLGHIGGLDKSVQNEQIYVNPATGSDTEGTGSSGQPYASLWFLPFLPRVILHDYRILIFGDVNHGGILSVDHSFKDNGCLSFIGVGAAVDPYSGVLDGTISGHANFNSTTMEIQASLAPQITGHRYFIKMKDGPEINHAAPLVDLSVGSSLLDARANPLLNVNNGNAYTYIIPAHTVTITGANIHAQSGHNAASHDVLLNTSLATRINFVNLNIDCDSPTDEKYAFITAGAPVGFWFVRLLVTPDEENVVFLNDVNRFNPVADPLSLENASLSGITNTFLAINGLADSAGLAIVNRDGDEFSWNDAVVVLEKNARVNCVDCMGRWIVRNTASEIWQCSGGTFDVYSSHLRAINVLAHPKQNGGGEMCVQARMANIWWDTGVVGTCDNGFDLTSSWLRMGVESRFSSCVNGCQMKGLSKVQMQTAWLGQVTTGADIDFPEPGIPTTSPFPGAGAVATDGIENSVKGP